VRALAFGFGALLGWSAWANWPQLPDRASGGAVVLVLVVIVCAFFGGRATRRDRSSAAAVAQAEATAVAQQAVNVYVGPSLHTGAGPRASACPAVEGGDEGTAAPDVLALPWLGERVPLEQLVESGAFEDAGLEVAGDH
jgi:hypothetical protein